MAALSHPHIAALFDIGETDGMHYLVMELLEGETLAARLRRGARRRERGPSSPLPTRIPGSS